MAYNTKEYKKKTKNVIAKSMLELSEAKRLQRNKRDDKLGYYTDNNRVFV